MEKYNEESVSITQDIDFSTFTLEELGKASAELEIMIGKIYKILNKYQNKKRENR